MAGSDIKAGAAYIELYLKKSAFAVGLKQAGTQLRSFGAGLAKIGGLATAGGMAIVGPILGAAKAFAKTGDELDKMSARVGASVPFLSALGHAAALGGTELGSMETGIRRLQRAAHDASAGSKTQADAFAELGISVTDTNGQLKATEGLFMEVAGALSGLENNTQKAALAQILFGRAGTSLLPMLRGGKEGLLEAMKNARELGLVMSKEDATSAAKLTDALYRLGATLKMALIRVGGAVADNLTDLAERIARVAGRVANWIRDNKLLIVSALKIGVAIAAAGAAITGLGAVVIGAGVALQGLAMVIGAVMAVGAALGTALAAIVSPIGLITVGIAAGAAALLHFSGAGKAVADALGRAWAGLKADTLATFDSIKTALAAGDLRGAATVFWAYLKLEWAKGISFLTEKWVAFKASFQRIWLETAFGLAAIWIEAIAKLETAWVGFTNAFMSKWKKAESVLAKGIGWSIAKVEGLDPSQVMADVDRQYRLQEQGRQRAAAQRLADVEKERAARQAALAEELTRREAADKKAGDDQVAKAKAAAADAEAAWRAAQDRVAANAAAVKVKAAEEEPPPAPPEIEAGAAAASKIFGTFSARAAALFGGAGRSDDARATARNTKESAEALKEMNRRDRARSGLVYV